MPHPVHHQVVDAAHMQLRCIFGSQHRPLHKSKSGRLIVHFFSIWAAIIICLASTGLSQSSEPQADSTKSNMVKRSPGTLITYDLSLSAINALAVITAPADLGWKRWIATSAVLGVTAITFSLDEKVFNYMQSHQSATATDLINPFQYYGYFPVAAGLSGTFYLAGLGFSQPWLRETAREAMTSIFLAGTITSILKVALSRSRPTDANGPFDFRFFELNDKYHSFPSGHATTAFALSSVLASRIDNPIFSAGLYTLAALTATQRIYSTVHWLSDIAMGASIGTTVGIIVAKNSKEILKSNHCWEISPQLNGNNTGVVINYSF